eukprot:2303059-Amphidinium_carterae.1
MEVDKDGDEEMEPDVAERMRALQQDIEKLKGVLGDSDPAVLSRVKQQEELAKKRPLATQMAYVQRNSANLRKRSYKTRSEDELELQKVTSRINRIKQSGFAEGYHGEGRVACQAARPECCEYSQCGSS